MFRRRDSCRPRLNQISMMFMLSCLLPCFLSAGLAQTMYTITDLGTLGGPRSVGEGINASGQVTGWSDTNSTLDQGHAFIYTPGANPPMLDLGTLGGLTSAGDGINSSGQVTGGADPGTGASHVFLDKGTMTDLLPGGFGNSNGFSINDSGWITGLMDIENDGAHAFLYDPDTHLMTDLTPGVDIGVGNGINASGWVTGYYGSVATAHAFLYRNGTLLDLNTLSGGTYSIGHGINSSGQITGWGDTNGKEHAFLYSNGTMTDIDPSGSDSQGLAINACGQITGARGGHAFLYSREQGLVNLNDLLPSGSGWDLVSALSINDHGQVTGYGYHNGAEHAFLLTPVSDGAFVCTGSMQAPRTDHAATLLSGGDKVLITGGSDGSTGSLITAEVYDSTSGSFRFTEGQMSSPRYAHTATLLDSGYVLIAGGYDSLHHSYLTSADLYNPSDTTIASTGSMSFPRQWHTATLLNNSKVLIAGGLNGSVLQSAELYDPAAGTFTPINSSMSNPRYGHAATMLNDGRVLITGGCTGGQPDCVNTAELYDPVANTFTPTGPMQDVHAWHTATLLSNGAVLIAGGNQGSIIASAELYDPSTGTFRSASPMMGKTAVYHTVTTLLEGSLLIAGGSWDMGVTNQAQLYSPLTGSFSLVAGTMSSPRFHHTATRLGNGQVLIAGGENGGTPNAVLASADLYEAPRSITQPLSNGGGTASFIFDSNVYNILYQYPKDFVPPSGCNLTVTPIQTSQADWGARTLPPSPYAGTQLAPVAGLGGDGIIYEAVSTCPEPPLDASFTITTSWDGRGGDNPGFLKAPIDTNNWENVFVSYSATRLDGGPDPTVVGKSKDGFSDWAVVYDVAGTAPSIQVTTPAGGATYTLNQTVSANYSCTGASVLTCIGPVANGGVIDTSSLGSKTFTVNATVSAGPSAVQTVTYNVVDVCHYTWFTLNPSTVPLGGSTKVTANLHSCSNISQKVVLQFAWTVPAPGSCTSNKTVVLTTPAFLLKPQTSISFTFPLLIPKKICTGTYTVSAATLVGGVVADTISSSLTVTSK
jgi:probable HAF family extracellular repeat protein